jgi:hypothetical protein
MSWIPLPAAPIPVGVRGTSRLADDAPARMESNVYLDGMLVGRFVTAHLGREASRPSAGATGVDGRLSPAWIPGAI